MDECIDPPLYLSSHPDPFPELSHSVQIGRGGKIGGGGGGGRVDDLRTLM